MSPPLTSFQTIDPQQDHRELLSALRPLGDARRGEAVRVDRGSAMEHLGIPIPALRARVRQGFAFDAGTAAQRLARWDALWRHTSVADVQLAVLEHWLAATGRAVPAGLWDCARHWPARVDNWCVSDSLSLLLARLLQAHPEAVLPQLQQWNAGAELWPRRLSITALVHGWGRGSVFQGGDVMAPMLASCVADHRHYIALALGWVLREWGRADAGAADAFLLVQGTAMSAPAWNRAVSLRSPVERARLAAEAGRRGGPMAGR